MEPEKQKRTFGRELTREAGNPLLGFGLMEKGNLDLAQEGFEGENVWCECARVVVQEVRNPAVHYFSQCDDKRPPFCNIH